MNRKKHHVYYKKIKKDIHDRLVEKIYSNIDLIKDKIDNFVYFEKYPKIGNYVPDLAFLCKTNKTEKEGLYKLLIVEVKSNGYGKSYREAEIKLYKILNSFIKEKEDLIKKYSEVIEKLKERKLVSLYFGYRIAFEDYFYNINVVKPVTWEDRDP
ncbi:MAG: hypothetical protein QW117_01290 [Candidatus Pacearchaeota archaeon]